jgi:hypothetical protein
MRPAPNGQSNLFTRRAKSGYDVTHHFCPDCGTSVYWLPGRVAVALGAFGDPAMPAPDQQVHLDARHPWADFPFPAK